MNDEKQDMAARPLGSGVEREVRPLAPTGSRTAAAPAPWSKPMGLVLEPVAFAGDEEKAWVLECPHCLRMIHLATKKA